MGKNETNRNVHCLMGLPFDAVTLDEAARRVRQSALENDRCFISTPNLNFVIAARSDPEFRDSVLRSDLSLADGMPLVWVARLLGLPIRERVSGAGLFERLLADPGEPVTVYFFGGPQGAAEAASRKVNGIQGGLRCVGFDSPGFGDLPSISTDEHIERINRSGAMFVIVSLGAKKGQRWIEMNRHRLRAPVVCHLGAVVNFAAGTVQRAPRWIQRVGGEWLWRIAQEPSLWARYWSDGLAFLGLLLREVLPLWVGQKHRSRERSGVDPDVRSERGETRTTLALSGAWDGEDIDGLRAALRAAQQRGDSLTVDLGRTVTVGSAVLGTLMLAKAVYGGARRFEILNANPRVSDTMARFGASFLLEPTP
jgi:N-acetylglucosaminyldiphosphoundecaprenol N-acetyl-beta-D-mannosaminyltransferase